MKKQTNTQISTTNEVSTDVLYLNDMLVNDLKSSALVVSLLVNMVVMIAYMIVQSTSVYDHQVISLLLAR